MDKLKVQNQNIMSKRITKRKPMKVVYIADPMMFKAKNSVEFKSLVQELTGQDSTVANYEVTTEFSSFGTSKKLMLPKIDEISFDEESPRSSSLSSIDFNGDETDRGMLETITGFNNPFMMSFYDGIFD